MEEDQRAAIDQPGAVPILLDAAVSEIPIGHVIARVAQDQRVGHEGGGQVHPALVGEHVTGDVHATVQIAPFAPPGDQGASLRIVAHAEKAQVVDAGLHDAEV